MSLTQRYADTLDEIRAAGLFKSERIITSPQSAEIRLADGRTVRVKSGWRSADASEANFLRAVGGAACEQFTTVLGPGADAAHQDHLHFDLARHSKGRRVCRGGDEPVPDGGRMFSFFKDRSVETTGSIGTRDGDAGGGALEDGWYAEDEAAE